MKKIEFKIKEYTIETGSELKNLRHCLNMKRREMAEFCKCSKSYIEKLERGDRFITNASQEFRNKVEKLAKIGIAYERTKEIKENKKSILQKIKSWFKLKK